MSQERRATVRDVAARAGVSPGTVSKALNGTDRIRCESRRNCREAVDPTAPLWMQARATAIRLSSTAQTGFVEKIDFLRFREVSASYTLPTTWANAFRAQRATVTVAARNLGIITDYTGIDPESALQGANAKFIARFNHIESRLREQGRELASATFDEMESLWEEAKRLERENPIPR